MPADILLTDTLDIAITEDGDLGIDEAPETADVQLLLITAPGHWRDNVFVGIAMHTFINSPESPSVAITEGLQADGFRNIRVRATDPLSPIILAER
jgi:hypothetical protein